MAVQLRFLFLAFLVALAAASPRTIHAVNKDGSEGDDCSSVQCGAGLFCDTGSGSICKNCTTCIAGTYVSTECSSSSNRACQACTPGTDYSDTDNAVSCTTCSTCQAGTYVTHSCDADHDRTCSSCSAGTDYSDTTNAVSCTTCTTCQAGNYVTHSCDADHDRTCAACTNGETFSTTTNAVSCTNCMLPCPSGTTGSACTTTADRGTCTGTCELQTTGHASCGQCATSDFVNNVPSFQYNNANGQITGSLTTSAGELMTIGSCGVVTSCTTPDSCSSTQEYTWEWAAITQSCSGYNTTSDSQYFTYHFPVTIQQNLLTSVLDQYFCTQTFTTYMLNVEFPATVNASVAGIRVTNSLQGSALIGAMTYSSQSTQLTTQLIVLMEPPYKLYPNSVPACTSGSCPIDGGLVQLTLDTGGCDNNFLCTYTFDLVIDDDFCTDPQASGQYNLTYQAICDPATGFNCTVLGADPKSEVLSFTIPPLAQQCTPTVFTGTTSLNLATYTINNNQLSTATGFEANSPVTVVGTFSGVATVATGHVTSMYFCVDTGAACNTATSPSMVFNANQQTYTISSSFGAYTNGVGLQGFLDKSSVATDLGYPYVRVSFNPYTFLTAATLNARIRIDVTVGSLTYVTSKGFDKYGEPFEKTDVQTTSVTSSTVVSVSKSTSGTSQQQASSNTDNTLVLGLGVGFGVVGVIAIVLVIGFLVTRPTSSRYSPRRWLLKHNNDSDHSTRTATAKSAPASAASSSKRPSPHIAIPNASPDQKATSRMNEFHGPANAVCVF